MPESTDGGTSQVGSGPTSAGTVPSSTPFAGAAADHGLTPAQLSQVQTMIDRAGKATEDKLGHVRDSLEAKIEQLPSEAYLKGLAREARYWVVGTVIAIIASIFLFINYGRDQFEAGITLTTGTISYSLNAKEAADRAKESAEKSEKQFKEVMEYLKRREESPPQSKKAP